MKCSVCGTKYYTNAQSCSRSCGQKRIQGLPKERFLKNILKTNYCWIWTGSTRTKMGYGCFSVDNKTASVTRFSYEYFNGKIPNGLCVLHKCDNPKCVNPDHLFLGTIKDNDIDRDRKFRNPMGEQSHYSKLKTNQVFEILGSEKTIQNKKMLCRKFCIGKLAIDRIWNGITWKHITIFNNIPRGKP